MSELERYRPLARSIARGYFLPGADRDDVEQEALIALWIALRSYDPAGGLALANWIRFVVHRRLKSAVKLALARKHGPLSDSLRARDEEGVTVDPLDLVPDERSDPARIVEAREELAAVLATIARDLSPRERQALVGYANGLSYAEIAGELGLPVRERRDGRARSKAIDNALQRARAKLADPPTCAAAAA